MQHHMLGEGLGLRHLCDWSKFVDSTIDQAFWQEKFLPFIEKIGLLTYAKVITKVGAIYLGCKLPDWAKDADDNLCFEVVDDMFKNGNFGKKDKERAMSGTLISEHGKKGTKHGKLYNAFSVVHKSVLRKFPIVKKLVIIYPFLWLYVVGKYLFLTAIGKRPNLTKTILVATERKTIYDKLHVFETEE